MSLDTWKELRHPFIRERNGNNVDRDIQNLPAFLVVLECPHVPGFLQVPEVWKGHSQMYNVKLTEDHRCITSEQSAKISFGDTEFYTWKGTCTTVVYSLRKHPQAIQKIGAAERQFRCSTAWQKRWELKRWIGLKRIIRPLPSYFAAL